MRSSTLSIFFGAGATRALLAALAIFVIPGLPSARAALKNWDGSVNGLWSTAANWTPAGAPANGDILNFPAAVNLTCTNDLAGRRFDSLNFSVGGYLIRGNGIFVTNGITTANGAGSTLDINLTLGANQAFANNSSGFVINGAINLNGFSLTANCDEAADFLTFGDRVTGTGLINKTGLGVLRLTGTNANDYAGLTAVTTGTLRLLKSDGVTAVPGNLALRAGAAVVWFTEDQVANTSEVSLGSGATLDLNGHVETIGALIATSATVDLGGGTLTLGGDVTVNGAATSVTAPGTLSLGTISRTIDIATGATLSIPANLTGGFRTLGIGVLIYAGFTKEGAGTLTLSGTNTYGGGTVVNAGRINANSDTAFGATVLLLSTPGAVTVNPGALITLNSADIGNKSLFINAPGPGTAMSASGVSSWSGVITLNTNAIFTTGGTLALSNSITGPGGLTMQSSVASAVFRFAGTNANTYTGDTALLDGTLQLAQVSTGDSIPTGSLQIGDGDGTDTVILLDNNQIGTGVDITLSESGVLNLNNFSDFTGDLIFEGGRVMTGSGTITPDNITVNATTFNASISGELNLSGARTWTVHDGSTSPCEILVTAIISGTGSLIKNGTGTLCLSGNNTYTGLTTVNDGQLILRHSSALGGTNAGTTLNGASLLTLENNVHVGLEGLTNNGSGIVNLGTVLSTGGSNAWAGPIVINAATIINTGNAADTLSLSGSISGPASLTKINPGALWLDGAAGNTFGGDLFAREGLLVLGKSVGEAVPHDLIIGVTGSILSPGTTATARQTQNTLILGSVTVNAGSLYDLNGFLEVIVDLTLNGGGDVQTGAGTLSVFGEVTVNGGGSLFGGTTSTINGNLDVLTGTRTFTVAETGGFFGDGNELVINARVSGSANIVKTGAGDMALTAANIFTGSVTVNDGELNISDNSALGTTTAGTSVTGDGLLGLSDNITVTGESLTLNSTGQDTDGTLQNTGGTNTWTGVISLTRTAVVNVATNTALILTGVMNAGGGVTKTGPGRLEYTGTQINTYGGITTVNEGSLVLSRTGGDGRSIPSALIVGDGAGGNSTDLVDIIGIEAQLNNLAAVTVNSSGLLRLSIPGGEVIGSLAGDGRVQLNGTGLFTGGNNATTVFDGVIAGTGPLIKRGAGIMTLNGFNTYSGATTVEAGTLLVNGGVDSSTVTVNASTTLGGSGVVGALNVNNLGNLAPGTSPGVLRSRNTVLSPGSNFRVEIAGAGAGTGHDQLNVDGTINLNGALLLVTKSASFAPFDGQQFVILDNDLADAVVGAFGGMAEGSVFSAGGTSFRISYAGGTGNDVTLAVTNIPARFASARVESGNGNGRIDPNECDHLFVTIENRTGSALTSVSARLDSLTPGVAVTQHDSPYANIPALGFGTNTTPFQIRVSPDFACGQDIQFNLVVSAAGFANFSLPFTLNSGGVGAFTTFVSTNVPKAIPDLGTTNSLILVTNSFFIAKARVSVHATHPAAGDLRLRLVSPSGAEVLLSANRGGNVANYGNSCAARTTFDDDAATKIAAASAPFAGTFAPEGNLAALIGAGSSGTWRLFVDDTVAGDTGTLQCWSLLLAPASCADGDGGCESCLASVPGTITGASPALVERLTRNGLASGCGNAKPCPGTTGGANPFRFSTHTFTNTGPDTCVTVVLNVPCAASTNGLQSAGYLASFDPADLCANYLGDGGQSIVGSSVGYSFRVAAGAKFVVVVNEVNTSGPEQGCGDYTLDLYGLPCPPPTLFIEKVSTPPDRVRLHWSTAYPGFQLQRSASLNGVPPFPFANVPTVPFVIGGDYNVTNSATANDDYFRLRKP